MVKVRRVLFRDWVKERDSAAPNRWHITTGTLVVDSNTLLIKKLLGTGSAVAPAEATTVCGTIPQAGEIYFDVQMNLANFADPYEPTM